MVLSVARLALRLSSIGKQQSPALFNFFPRRGRSHHGNQILGQQFVRAPRKMASMSTSTSISAPQNNNNNNSYVFNPPPITSLPVVGTNSRFPVRRVYCVGKNYAAHVVEMGGDLERSNPVFFTKPSFGGVVYAGSPEFELKGAVDVSGNNSTSTTTVSVKYPPNTNNLHYEVELVVAIGKELGSNNDAVSDRNFLDCVYGYAVGIDFTRRDLQAEAKSKGLPWDTGKYFDESAPMGPITPSTPTTTATTLENRTMELIVNGETRQSVRLENMIWKVPEIIAELSKSFALKPGDLIMTGTPSGVGPVYEGDRLVGSIDGLVEGVDVTLT